MKTEAQYELDDESRFYRGSSPTPQFSLQEEELTKLRSENQILVDKIKKKNKITKIFQVIFASFIFLFGNIAFLVEFKRLGLIPAFVFSLCYFGIYKLNTNESKGLWPFT